MENYFQAEAFNLDKVLDEFEQNEGERRAKDGRGNECGEETETKSESVNQKDGWDETNPRD